MMDDSSYRITQILFKKLIDRWTYNRFECPTNLNALFEPTCAYARWAHMRHFPSVWTRKKIHISKSIRLKILIKVHDTGRWAHINVKLLHLYLAKPSTILDHSASVDIWEHWWKEGQTHRWMDATECIISFASQLIKIRAVNWDSRVRGGLASPSPLQRIRRTRQSTVTWLIFKVECG